MTFPHSFPFAVFHVSSTRVTAGADWRHPFLRRLLCRVLLHPLLHVDELVFGFTLLLVFLILTTTCAEITAVLIYFQLCSEDYYWWWRSFLTAGDSPLTWRLSLFAHSLSCSIFFIYVCCFLGLTFIFLSLLFLLCLSSSFSGVNEPLLRVHGDLRVCILGCLLLKARARHVRAVELTWERDPFQWLKWSLVFIVGISVVRPNS